jgi:2',3'-cyclic-nucleotide 2'-phosphodiesterase/3'-nucleotidase
VGNQKTYPPAQRWLEPPSAEAYAPFVNIHTPAFSRRRFLRALGHGALLTALPGQLLADEGHAVTISILHTTDLHGHILPTVDYDDHPDLGGLARCATQIRQWQRANPNSVLIDIGDVYQGTEIGLHAQGTTMIRCLNALNYDAWVIGNHEFDWGMEPFAECVKLSNMPVLSANAMIHGKPVGKLDSSTGSLSKLRPWLLKEVAGFRLLFIGLTTPALSTWLPPENLAGFESLDPIESLRGILHEAKSLKPDAIVLTGHMGLIRQDNYANPVGTLTREFPELVVFIGGHTHQNHSSEIVNNVLYTQADHYGIYAGKVDLTFDPVTRKLLKREAITVPMDHTIALDPLVLSMTRSELDAADQTLARAIGELTEPFGVTSSFGKPSDTERLIGSAIMAALHKQGCEIDAVVHGLFDDKHPLLAGTKTVADAWDVLPYENQIVTIDVSRDDLLAIARDVSMGRDFRNIMGMRVVGVFDANQFSVTDLQSSDGTPLPAKPTYRIALNSYDSQSAGQRFPMVARLVSRPSSNRILHPIQVRDAFIDFLVTRQKVGKSSLLV